MKSTKNLRLRLRLIEGALALLLGAATTAAVTTHQLLLDAGNRPTSSVNLAGPQWTGTLDAARLPVYVNFAAIGNDNPGYGVFSTLRSTGYLSVAGLAEVDDLNCDDTLNVADETTLDNGTIFTDGSGDFTFNAATLSPLTRAEISTPPSGVTLYANGGDGLLHYVDATGTDHTLNGAP